MIGRPAAQALHVAGLSAYVAGEMLAAARDGRDVETAAAECLGPLLAAAMTAIELSGLIRQDSSAAVHDVLADYLNLPASGPVIDVTATRVHDMPLGTMAS
jgi:hypothetical protein